MPVKDPNTDHLRYIVAKIVRDHGPITASGITTKLGGMYNRMQVGNAISWCVSQHHIVQHSNTSSNKATYVSQVSTLSAKLMSVPWNKEGLESIFT